MKNNLQAEIIEDLTRRKKTSREFLRNLPPEEKIAKLVELQERYYEMLKVREATGGREIPGRWRKWHAARNETGLVLD